MNTDNNQRFQDTEKKITDAYAKIVKSTVPEKVTVTDICREAGIHRTTFYGHFQDIPELTAHIEQQRINKMISAFFKEKGSWNLRIGFQKQLEFYRRNRAVIRRHMNSQNNAGQLFSFYSPLSVKEYREAYMKTFHCETENEYEYHQAYFNAGITAIIKKWVATDCKEAPECIADYIIKFLNLPDL